MRRAFDGTEIQQKPQQQQQQYGKPLGQPPLHPMRPASAKPPAYNNLLQNNMDQQDEQSPYHQQNLSNQNFSENNINSNRGYYGAQNQQPRQFSGMQRNNSGHRNYENNMMQLNRTAQQLNKINSQLNTSGVDTYGGDVAKHMPRIIHQDKEQLYADTLSLKNQVNELKEGNKTLKTQLYQSERDLVKYKKIVDQYEANGVVKGFYPKTESGHITENLKRTIKDLKTQLAMKEEESNKIKKQVKFTRIQELDIERKSYAEECTRLKNLLQQALNEKMEVLIKETDYQKLEERFYSVSNEAEQLRFDNREMAQQLKGYDNQNNYLQRSYNELEKKSNLQITTLRKHLKERDREINELKNEISKFRLQSNNQSSKKDISNPLPASSSNRLARPQSAKNNAQFNTETGFLKKQLEMKDDRIRQLEEDVIQLRHELTTQGNHGPDDYDDDEKAQSNSYRNQSQNNYHSGSIQQQPNQTHEERNQQFGSQGSKHQEIKIEQQQQQQQQQQQKLHYQQDLSKKSSNQIQDDQNKNSIDGVLRINSDSNMQYVNKIKREDIAHIGEELQYKLRSHALNLREAAQLFFENLDEKTSIRDLQAMLLDKPFNLQQNDALLLSRYLVEDKDGKYKFDWEYSRKNEYIFQSFNDIVGTYQVFSKGYAQKLYNYLSEIKPGDYEEDADYDNQGEYDEDEDGAYEESNDYREAEEYVQQNQNNNNQVKLQRPQSSKRKNPQPNNQIEQGDDEYYDQSGQGIEEDNDDDGNGQYYDEEEDGYGQYGQSNKNLNQDRSINKEEESIIKKYADRKSSNEYEGKIKSQQNQNNHLTPQQYDEILKQKEKELLKSWRDDEDEEIEDEQESQKYPQDNYQQDNLSEDDLQQYVEDEFEKNKQKKSKELPQQSSKGKAPTNKQQEDDLYEEDFDDKPPTKKGSKADNKAKNQKENNYDDDFDIISDDNS